MKRPLGYISAGAVVCLQENRSTMAWISPSADDRYAVPVYLGVAVTEAQWLAERDRAMGADLDDLMEGLD